MATKTARWETRPLDCWTKAKELRREHYEGVQEAGEAKKKPVIACWGSSGPICAGLEHEALVAEAYAANVATFGDLAQECLDVVEDWGFMQDICPYPKLFWGSMMLNKTPWGPFPKPDLIFQDVGGCATHGKFPQFVAEYLGIPHFAMDSPRGCHRLEDPKDLAEGKDIYLQNIMEQYWDFIEWLEKNTGQRLNDEKIIENLRNEREVSVWISKVWFLNQAIPAPLDTKCFYALGPVALGCRGTKEAVDFYHTMYDEVKWRVDNRIAWLGTERCRLIDDNLPPWYAMRILRYVNKWGATYVAGPYGMSIGGLAGKDDLFCIPKTFEEEGVTLRTREDVVRYLAERAVSGENGQVQDSHGQIKRLEWVFREWKAQGATVRNNIGCTGRLGLQEAAYILRQKGMPIISYDCSLGDRRGYNEARVIDSLEAFLEGTLGLDRLEE